jgi:hypothetical protein
VEDALTQLAALLDVHDLVAVAFLEYNEELLFAGWVRGWR